MYEYNVDFYLNGDWLDKTADVKVNSGKISGGIKDEGSKVVPSRFQFTMLNSSGDYNPRNPVGAYYGELGKNTPVRVRHQLLADNVSETDTDGWGANWDNGAGSGGSVVNTDWSRTGTTNTHSVPAANAYRTSLLKAVNQYEDSCLRTRVTLPTSNLTGGAVWSEIQFRYIDTSNYLAVQFIFNTDETVSVQVVEQVSGSPRILLAATTISGLSVTTDQTFELATLVEGQVVRTKIWATGDPEPADWQTTCTRATVRYGRTGIRSTVQSGNSNTKPFLFTYTNTVVEARPFVGEISEYAIGFGDYSHAAPIVKMTASGITQRTQQGSEPFKSAMFRWWSADQKWVREGAALATATGDTNTLKAADADAADIDVGTFFRLLNNYEGTGGAGDLKEDQLFTITSKSSSGGITDINFTPDAVESTIATDNLHTNRYATSSDLPIAYWPGEDGKNSTEIASGLVGGKPMSYTVAVPEFGAKDSFVGSAPIMKLNNAELYAEVPDYTDTNQAFTLHFMLHMPDVDEAATGTDIVQFYTTGGSAEIWEIQYATGGSDGDLVIRATGSGVGGTLLFSTPYGMHARGTPIMVTLALQHTAPTTVTYSLAATYFENDGTFITNIAGNVTATGVSTLGKIKSIRVNPGGGYVDVGFGHLAVVPSAMDTFNLADAPRGYLSEDVMRRFIRLGYEEDIPVTFCGTNKPSVQQMGAQREATVLDNMQDAALFDGGRFYEARGAYSFEYRSRATLYNQTPFLEVDYSDGGVQALDPSDDDKDIRNDVTAKRIDGGFSRAVLETGRLSVQAPANGGVGRYTESVDLAAQRDDQLPDHASWRLHLGTTDEERYPSVRLRPTGDITMAQLMSVGVGKRFKVTDLEDRNVYEPIDQLVLGYTLVLHQDAPYLEINGEPARPYNVLDLDTGRMDSDTSTLNEDLDTTETAIDVATTGGTLWTTDAGEFPFDILVGGERMTVTNITGASSPQTFTVTRSVNGVVKSHSTGATVSLADPVYLPL